MSETHEREPLLTSRDYRLSMQLSPRGKSAKQDLRTLLLHRLRRTQKAVWRRPLRAGVRPSLFCEECQQWTPLADPGTEVACPECDTDYVVEAVIYSRKQPAVTQ